LYKTGLGYVWVEREGRDLKEVYQIIIIFHNHIQREGPLKKKERQEISSLVLEYTARVGERTVSLDHWLMNKRTGLEGAGIINRNTVLYRNFQGIIHSKGKL